MDKLGISTANKDRADNLGIGTTDVDKANEPGIGIINTNNGLRHRTKRATGSNR